MLSTSTIESIVPAIGRVHPVDYVTNLTKYVPRERLNRVLFCMAANQPLESENATLLLTGLKSDNDQGLIQPPLDSVLAHEIDFVLNQRVVTPHVASFLLTWAHQGGEK